jgi:hypothetical protein
MAPASRRHPGDATLDANTESLPCDQFASVPRSGNACQVVHSGASAKPIFKTAAFDRSVFTPDGPSTRRDPVGWVFAVLDEILPE